jgi:hypothetical protein
MSTHENIPGTRAELRESYEKLMSLHANAPKADKIRRGYGFENLIRDLLSLEHLDPRIRIRPSGEEIDGSFVYRNRVFLLEAKWRHDPQPASALYEFKGKLDGKLHGTIGVFISINGFSSNAVDSLLKGKALNMVLFDGKDFEACFLHQQTFSNVLDFKLRAAAEIGSAFESYQTATVDLAADKVEAMQTQPRQLTSVAGEARRRKITVICEGQSAEFVLSKLTLRLPRRTSDSLHVQFVVTNGKINAARTANGWWHCMEAHEEIVVVVDSDGDVTATQKIFDEGLRGYQLREREFDLIIVDPEVEAWLFSPEHFSDRIHVIRAMEPSKRQEALLEAIEEVNIEDLKRRDNTFVQYARHFEGHP